MSQPEKVLVTDMAEAQSGGDGVVEFHSIEAVFLALEAPLLAYALRLLKVPVMAEDVVQEAFTRLHAEFDSVREPRRWLYRAVHNLALNQLRRDRKVVPLHPAADDESPAAQDPADPRPLPDEELARIEHVGLVRLSLNTLDERSRELIRLKFHEDLSYQQMSERTGLTVGHVGYLLHHALKTVGAELTRNGVMP